MSPAPALQLWREQAPASPHWLLAAQSCGSELAQACWHVPTAEPAAVDAPSERQHTPPESLQSTEEPHEPAVEPESPST